MKKKFVCLMMALLFCVSALAGCSLVTRNDAKYYNATVATLTYEDGTVETISKRDLLVAYNNYGYYYVDYYGYTTSQAITSTLDSLIETRVICKAVEDYYVEQNEAVLEESETTYLWDETCDSLLENLRSYYNDITGNSDSEEEDSDEDASSSIFVDYTAEAKMTETITTDSDGNSSKAYSIVRTSTTSTTRETYNVSYSNGVAYDFEYEDPTTGEMTFQEIMYKKIVSLTTSTDQGSKNWKSALAEYIDDIRDNYSYMDLGSDEECFKFEMNRIYEILKDNYLVQKFTEIYDYDVYGDGEVASLSVRDILSYYSAKVRAAYNDYVMTGSADDPIDDVGSTYYIAEGDNANSYFSVAYIKIEFSDEDAETVEDLMDESSSKYANYSAEERDVLLETMYANLSVNVRDATTGEETSQSYTSAQLYELIKKALGTDSDGRVVNSGNDNDDIGKAEIFRDFFYRYNDDDTYKNADYNAVFGVDVSGNVLLNDDFDDYDSEYQDAIKEAIKTLYNNGNANVGDITNFVRTNDGVYMFFYAGKISNLFTVDANFDVSKDLSNIEVLESTRLNIFSSKTVFNAIYETLYSDGYSTYESLKVTDLLSKVKREIDNDQIKDLY